MNRRGFLGTILAAGMAPAIVKASSLMPLWVPRANPYEVVVPITYGNTLLTPSIITREALRLLEQNVQFKVALSNSYHQRFWEEGSGTG